MSGCLGNSMPRLSVGPQEWLVHIQQHGQQSGGLQDAVAAPLWIITTVCGERVTYALALLSFSAGVGLSPV